MSSILHRRRAVFTRHQSQRDIPAWRELVRLEEEEVQALAESLGIAWEGRMQTLSAINRRRPT